MTCLSSDPLEQLDGLSRSPRERDQAAAGPGGTAICARNISARVIVQTCPEGKRAISGNVINDPLFPPHHQNPKPGVAVLPVLRIRAHAADPVRAGRVWRHGAGQRKWRRRSCWRRSRSRTDGDDDDDDDSGSSGGGGNGRKCCWRRRSFAHGRRL